MGCLNSASLRPCIFPLIDFEFSLEVFLIVVVAGCEGKAGVRSCLLPILPCAR